MTQRSMGIPTWYSLCPCKSSLRRFVSWILLIIECSFLVFTDYCIYWIHRWLHHPILYKRLHKPHHKWISESESMVEKQSYWCLSLVPTPFASHAFHFADGFAQSFPYHLFILLFPIHRPTYLVLFVLINMWSIFVSFANALPFIKMLILLRSTTLIWSLDMR